MKGIALALGRTELTIRQLVNTLGRMEYLKNIKLWVSNYNKNFIYRNKNPSFLG